MENKLAKVLRDYRIKLGYSYPQANKATGVDHGFIRRIELGEVTPGLGILQKLADGYGTTVLTILKEAGLK